MIFRFLIVKCVLTAWIALTVRMEWQTTARTEWMISCD